jgi:hypothetical protein
MNAYRDETYPFQGKHQGQRTADGIKNKEIGLRAPGRHPQDAAFV